MTIVHLVGSVGMSADLASYYPYQVRYHLSDGSDRIESFFSYSKAFARWLAISDSLEAERNAKADKSQQQA